jgi:MoaA/NifB/PqqE/SkfB family radical SAM enzyme
MLPAVCDISVTNLCNATCDFCAFAHDKGLVKNRRFVDRDALARALPILRRRGIEYFNLQGGEPLLHPQVDGLVGDAVLAGFKVALITNGWQLAQKIEGLIAAGLGTLLVSIDSHSLESHEKNRGLIGVGAALGELPQAVLVQAGVERIAEDAARADNLIGSWEIDNVTYLWLNSVFYSVEHWEMAAPQLSAH